MEAQVGAPHLQHPNIESGGTQGPERTKTTGECPLQGRTVREMGRWVAGRSQGDCLKVRVRARPDGVSWGRCCKPGIETKPDSSSVNPEPQAVYFALNVKKWTLIAQSHKQNVKMTASWGSFWGPFIWSEHCIPNLVLQRPDCLSPFFMDSFWSMFWGQSTTSKKKTCKSTSVP